MQIKVRETNSQWGPLELSVDLTEWVIEFIDNIAVHYSKNPNCLEPLIEAVRDFYRVEADLGDTFDAVELIVDEYEKLTGFKPVISKRYSTTETRMLIQKLVRKLAEVE